jgi:hypothetical protein
MWQAARIAAWREGMMFMMFLRCEILECDGMIHSSSAIILEDTEKRTR